MKITSLEEATIMELAAEIEARCEGVLLLTRISQKDATQEGKTVKVYGGGEPILAGFERGPRLVLSHDIAYALSFGEMPGCGRND